MLPVTYAETIIGFALLITAYILSVTIAGSAHAFIAQRFGDSSAADEGFLSGNPLTAIDILGMLCLLFCGFGWGRRPPFHPASIEQPYKSLKVLLVYCTEALCSLLLAWLSLMGGTLLSGRIALYIACNYHVLHDLFERISIHEIASVLPHAPPSQLLLILFCTICTSLNVLLCLWSIINRLCHYILYLGAEYELLYMRYEELLLLIGPLILFICVAPPLYSLLLYSVCKGAYLTSIALGIL